MNGEPGGLEPDARASPRIARRMHLGYGTVVGAAYRAATEAFQAVQDGEAAGSGAQELDSPCKDTYKGPSGRLVYECVGLPRYRHAYP